MGQTTQNFRVIKATKESIYQAFTDPSALAVWMAPGVMTGKISDFDLRVGGGYTMSLFYPDAGKDVKGKTSAKEDRYTSRFVELNPPRKIVQAINFDSSDPSFSGEMIMDVTFEEENEGTKVIFFSTPFLLFDGD